MKKNFFRKNLFGLLFFKPRRTVLQKKNSIFTNHQIEVEGGGAGVQISFARTLPAPLGGFEKSAPKYLQNKKIGSIVWE